MPVSQQIRIFMETRRISKSEIAKLLEITHPTATRLRAGDGNVRSDLLERFLEVFPEVDANWRITGEGDMYKDKKSRIIGPEMEIKGDLQLLIKAQEEKIELLYKQTEIHEKWSKSLEREITLLREKVRIAEKTGYNIAAESEQKYEHKKPE